MGSGFCGNCSTTPFDYLSEFSRTDKMVCPYCRSFRSEAELPTHSQTEFTMCSQLSSESSPVSPSLSHPSTKNVQKLSHNIHQHHQNQKCSTVHKISQSPKVPTSSGGVAEHISSSVVCRCAKAPTNFQRFSTTSSSHRANSCSLSIDGWRAARLVLLAILVLLPNPTMSSPVHHNERSISPHSSGHRNHHTSSHRPMKWINPCNIQAVRTTQPSELQEGGQTDEEIFQHIVTQTKKAEVQARRFFDDFKRECFGETGHDFKQLHYDWLKDVVDAVNKDLGEPVSQSRLETLKVDDILKSMYRGLQKLAVGLEQVVLDQGIHGGSFYNHFNEAEFQLKYVLCEFQMAMMEKNIDYEDITREIMDTSFTNLDDKTMRNIRDFSIFRDYLNTLEFIRESFEHFWKMAKRVQS